jgi:hypothetical protein
MNCVALPWASPELFADAALELENLESLLLVLSGAARGLFGVNMLHTPAWPDRAQVCFTGGIWRAGPFEATLLVPHLGCPRGGTSG